MDEEPAFLENATVMIVGMGLMGGSLAMALNGKCASIIGVDHDEHILRKALDERVIDAGYLSMEEIKSPVDVIILALPIKAILSALRHLPGIYPGKAIVLDLGSTKHTILQTMSRLPERFDPIGGHPMCGKENAGYLHAERDLFQNTTFAFIPLPRSSKKAIRFASEMCSAIGASPFWTDAKQHDRWVAITSHLPFILANSLVSLTPFEAARVIGPGFRSTARLAPSSPEMMRDILLTNRENILNELQRFQACLSETTQLLIEENYDLIIQRFNSGKRHYFSILKTEEKG